MSTCNIYFYGEIKKKTYPKIISEYSETSLLLYILFNVILGQSHAKFRHVENVP